MEDNSKIKEKKYDTALKILFIWWRPELLTRANKNVSALSLQALNRASREVERLIQ